MDSILSSRWRPMQPKDVRECVEVVASHPVIGPRYREAIADLAKAWLRLLTSDAMLTGVFEETEGGRIRPWCVGVSVIVTDDFLAELKKPPLCWIGPELARRLARDESPLMSARQLREANMAGGLNAVVWEGCIRAGYEDRPDLFHHIMGGFLDSHRGYLWKEIVASNADSVDRLQWTLYSGGRLWDPAAGRYVEAAERDLQEVVGEPHIVGTTRDIARARQSNWVDAMFHYRPPQVGFSRAEQLLLLAALRNEAGTDQELAATLGVSMPTVKKMWLSIYRRAAGLPELALDGGEPGRESAHRGKEKRRRLLAYLRDHPEELRPLSRKAIATRGLAPSRSSTPP
jgi:hypothetical protein